MTLRRRPPNVHRTDRRGEDVAGGEGDVVDAVQSGVAARPTPSATSCGSPRLHEVARPPIQRQRASRGQDRLGGAQVVRPRPHLAALRASGQRRPLAAGLRTRRAQAVPEPPPSLPVRHRSARLQRQGPPPVPAARRGDALREAEVLARRGMVPEARRELRRARQGRLRDVRPGCEPPGEPRQINRIAHYALSAAALAKARTVDAEHMQHALDELRPWTVPTRSAPSSVQANSQFHRPMGIGLRRHFR